MDWVVIGYKIEPGANLMGAILARAFLSGTTMPDGTKSLNS